jgi:hypothetical protein
MLIPTPTCLRMNPHVLASSTEPAAEASVSFFFFGIFWYFYVYVTFWLLGTFVSGFVLVHLYYSVPVLNYDSASLFSASFQLLLLFSSGGLDKFALICTIFTSVTILCYPLRGICHLSNQFPNFCLYIYIYFFFFITPIFRL